MTGSRSAPTLGIITPTFRREKLLRRFLKRIVRQSYPQWRLLIVHDGPSEESRNLVTPYKDSRIEYLQTDKPANDVGVTPRHAGASHFINGTNPPDYCIFWDDDNYFRTTALQQIATALTTTNHPDLLLVSMEYRARPLPPPGVPIAALQPGQIDTACLVIRTPLALAGYEEVLRQKRESPEQSLYTQDFMLFDHLRKTQPPLRIEIADDKPIGFHDGLRWKPYLRHLLGMSPLRGR